MAKLNRAGIAFCSLLLWVATAVEAARWWRVDLKGSVEITEEAPNPSLAADTRYLWRQGSPAEAPVEIPADQWSDIGGFLKELVGSELQVEILFDPKQEGKEPTTLIAAPVNMWDQVPEALLPRWPVLRPGKMSLPTTEGLAWRLRWIGKAQGSRWLEVAANSRRTKITAAAARSLSLLVVGEEGEPLPRARVWVGAMRGARGEASSSPFIARYGISDTALFLPSLPLQAPLRLLVIESEHQDRSLRGRVEEMSERIVLKAGATLLGRVVDARGEGIPEARILLEAWLTDGSGFVKLPAESGADGRWQRAGIPPGKAVLQIEKKGFPTLLEKLELRVGSHDLGDRTLRPGVWQPVLVWDPEGVPIAEARISIEGLEIFFTDSEGETRLGPLLPERPVEAQLEAVGYLPATQVVAPVGAAPGLLEVVLAPSLHLHGRLLEHGEPVQDGALEVSWSQGGGTVTQAKLLESGGLFSLNLQPGRPHSLLLWKTSGAQLRLELPPGAPGESRDLGDLELPMTRTAHGRLVSAEDGEGVPGARLWALRPGSTDPVVASLQGQLLETVSGPEGRFRLGGLGLAAAELRVEAHGYAPARVSVPATEDPEELSAELGEIELGSGSSLIIDIPASVPEEAVAELDLSGNWQAMELLKARVYAGRCVFRNLPLGRFEWMLRQGEEVFCDGWVRVAEHGEELQVACEQRAMQVSGQVTIGGRPAKEGVLTWLPHQAQVMAVIERSPSALGAVRTRVHGAGRPQRSVPVRPDGSYASDRLRPGTWQVAWSGGISSSSSSREVILPEVESLQLDLSFPGLNISGWVVDQEGERVAEVWVRELASGAVVRTSAEGEFDFLGLEPGIKYLRAEDGGLRGAVREADLSAESAAGIELVLSPEADPSARIEITVLAADDQPIGGAFVILEDQAGRQLIRNTNASGTLRFELEPPYPSRLRLAAWAEGSWIFGSWIGKAEASAEPMILQAGSTGSLVIEGSEASGPVTLTTDSGWRIGWLMRRLGRPLNMRPGEELRLDGLPPGSYQLSVGDGPQSALAILSDEETQRGASHLGRWAVPRSP